MRRVATVAMLAVAALFAGLALPGSPLRGRLAALFGDGLVESPAIRPSGKAEEGSPLRVAVGAMISPERTYAVYADLFRLLAVKLQRPFELKQRRTYQELNALIRRGEVDVAWICTGAWPELSTAGAARLLAVPVVDGKTTYNALVLAGPAAPRVHDLAGLGGRRFAFTDPISLTGCRYPRQRVAELGRDVGSFFSATSFTGGHDRSIEAVRRGLAAGASVDSLVFQYLARRFPEEVDGVRVLETSPPFPIPPLVVPASTPQATERLLREALLGLNADDSGRKLLDALLVDCFALADEEAYARLR